jgi:hypothetical protein
MNILLPRKGKYNIGDDFPMISIPTDISEMNPEKKTFDDFQWWAESSEFKKWMDKNKRQWVADSEDMAKHGDNLSDLIREHVGSYSFNNEINESDVLSFDEYDAINEDANDASLSAEAKAGIKFHYAYNKLKADGKLLPITSVDTDLPDGQAKAVFLVMEDPDTKTNIDETLKAFKMTGLPGDPNSKVKMVSVTETLPGGPIDENATTASLIEGILKTAASYAAIGAGIGVTWAILRKVGYTVAGVSALKALRGLAPIANAPVATGALAKSGAFIKKIGSGAFSGIKVLGKGLLDLAKFKNTGNAIKTAYSFGKTSLAFTKKLSTGMRALNFVKAVGRGGAVGAAKIATKAGTKGAARFIPFVGEVLMGIEAIGSTWNWFSDNQAPKWVEIEDTIAPGKGGKAFDPSKIKDGTAITICWRQPAGTGLGIATSFLYNNDTRTTAELFKIGKSKDGSSSIFVMTQVNSKEYQKALANYAAIIVSIKDGEINAQDGFLNTVTRALDNEDMDVEVAYMDTPDDMASNFNFEGICDWATAMEYYNNANDQYLISNSDAPETYEYYYDKFGKGDYINVAGKLLTDEEIGSKSDSDIQDIFTNANNKLKNPKPEPKDEKRKSLPGDAGPAKQEKDKFKEKEKSGGTGDGYRGDAEINDSENNKDLWLTPMVNESVKNGVVIRKFAEFEDVLEYVSTSGNYPVYSQLNEDDPVEKTEEADNNNLVLNNEEASEPAKIAVYAVTGIEYANPADRQYTPAAYRYFMIDPVDFDAAIDSSITVAVSTNDPVPNPKRGVYEFKEKRKKEEDEERKKPSPEVNPDQDNDGSNDTSDDNDDENKPNKDDYFITADPDDISIKNRKSATVIRDHNFKGGINIVDEFLTDKEKEVLGIPTWKAVTLAKTFMNGQGEVIKVKLKNRYAPLFNTAKTYEVQDGEAFQIAKKFAKEVEDRIKFQ